MDTTIEAARLAIDGGAPVRATPFPRRILVGPEERAAVLAVLDREAAAGGGFDRYGGQEVDAYEREFAAHMGAAYATATSSGTAAIHTALAALHLEPLREVICAPVTDPGGVMPIVWLNCLPVFADVDLATFNLDPRSVAERITERTGAIIVTHLAGQPADLAPILEIARRHGLPVIEDCAQAHDATYRGRKVGTFGDLAAFSLMGGKHSTSGGQGGMVLTNDEGCYWDAKRFADRGKPFKSPERGNLFLGMNYRMTELQAAIGRAQLRKLPAVVRKRRELAGLLRERLRGLRAVRLGTVIEGAEPAYWFLFVRVDAARLRVGHEQFAAAVAAEGVPVQAKYDHLVYEQPWLRDRRTFGQSGWPWTCSPEAEALRYAGSCPHARRAIDTHMVVALHEGYGEQEIADLAAAFAKVEAAYAA
jgi:perosamine synthetase